ncbi:MAG: hypothetical protein AUH72_00325 [Acidobacteria bacterium 13_1_40CM_4_65_8]|nr:MAG: hypothetical protein AUH72_00325 [Acidobacteria bacterium 13_1_40CM_4_65_8]
MALGQICANICYEVPHKRGFEVVRKLIRRVQFLLDSDLTFIVLEIANLMGRQAVFRFATPDECVAARSVNNSIRMVMDSEQKNEIIGSVDGSFYEDALGLDVCVRASGVRFAFEFVDVLDFDATASRHRAVIRDANCDDTALGGCVRPHRKVLSQFLWPNRGGLALDATILFGLAQQVGVRQLPELIHA